MQILIIGPRAARTKAVFDVGPEGLLELAYIIAGNGGSGTTYTNQWDPTLYCDSQAIYLPWSAQTSCTNFDFLHPWLLMSWLSELF